MELIIVNKIKNFLSFNTKPMFAYNGKLIIYESGKISLNLENKGAQDTIMNQFEVLKKIKV